MISSGAAGVHIEDQVEQKRCGHRPNKELVSSKEMQDRLKAAVDAKTDPDFMIMARTDALANEGLEAALERAVAYEDAGADAIFAEAVTEIDQYKKFSDQINVPLLANITEFGQTPLFSKTELSEVGVDMVLYPLSAFRAMSKAAEEVYTEILEQGTQETLLDKMQTRDELYEILDYHTFEKKLDDLFESKAKIWLKRN
jgi:methylisocitrate lyase